MRRDGAQGVRNCIARGRVKLIRGSGKKSETSRIGVFVQRDVKSASEGKDTHRV
jgi:hypothetical protein